MSIEIVPSQHSEIVNKLSEHTTLLNQIVSLLGGGEKPTYSATVLSSSTGANKHHLVITNSSTTSIVKILKIVVSAEVTSTVTGYEIGFRASRVTNVTGGTTINIAKFDTEDPDPSNISAVTNPTATVTSTLVSGSVNPEETGGGNFIVLYSCDVGKCITLRNGESLSVHQYGTAGVGTINVTIIFEVE